jgi:endonuclease YncB( thermonuclease family)
MKLIRSTLFAIAALVATPATAAPSYNYAVTGVYDGDTFYINMPGLPPELSRIGVRVRGIDTPEMRGKCESEKRNALAAKAFTTRVIVAAGRQVTLTNLKWDKYGGRVDADVFVGGQKLADMMITRGYARPYIGGKRAGWCE